MAEIVAADVDYNLLRLHKKAVVQLARERHVDKAAFGEMSYYYQGR